MRVIPNMIVLEPSDAVSTSKLIEECYRLNGPVYMRLGRNPVPIIYSENDDFKIGKAVNIKKGKDIAIIASGYMVYKSMLAVRELEKEGISCSLIDMHTIKPIDVDAIIEAASNSKLIVTVEEHNINGGLGGAVAEILTYYKPKPQLRIGINDIFCESDDEEKLRKFYGIDENGIKTKTMDYIKKNNIL